MQFADIHIHALCGADDGAGTEEEMYSMLEASYADGVRDICLTPHFHPGYFGNNCEKAEEAFRLLYEYAAEKHPDMNIYIGNELRYSRDCISWLADGICRTLNRTRCVLVDFQDSEESRSLIHGIQKLLNAGYVPVLAHAERYKRLDAKDIRTLRADGIIVQIDTQSVFGNFGIGAQRRCKRLLSEGLADIAATDAHNTSERPPTVSDFYAYALKKYGSQYADNLCRYNALKILNDNPVGKDNE